MTAARLAAALVDRYRIERELGAGGMATVYLAHDVRHDRRVALKVLRPELAAVIGAERFLSEIKTTANLQHPHILPLFDSGAADSFLFYVMPFIEGESLRDRLTREKQLPVDDAVRITREVASALDYAHRHHVIHRDIKPENILLHEGQALVADFGIALAVSAAGGTRMTETGMSLGTPHYMSPEQAMGEREITARSDVYALGAVAYEMLLGEPPFTGPTAQSIVAKVLTERPAAIRLRRDRVPLDVEAAVLTALEKLPADRFGTAAEFAAALTEPGRTSTVGRTAAPAAPGLRPARNQALIVVGALAILATGFALGGRLRQERPAPVMRFNVTFPSGEAIQSVQTVRVAISPDGSRLVYVGPDSGSGTQLWVRSMSSLNSRPLPGTGGAQAPFFNPEGTAVAFFVGLPGDLRVVPVDGGPVRTVVRDSAFPWGGDWHADGNIYFSRVPTHGLARVPATGGRLIPVSEPDTSAGVTEHDFPHVLPGGQTALLQAWATSFQDAKITLVDFATGTATPLLEGVVARYLPTGHILYVNAAGVLQVVPFDIGKRSLSGPSVTVAEGVQVDPSGGAGQFAASNSGTLLYMPGQTRGQVVWVDREGRITPVDSMWTGAFKDPALSPDGTRLVIAVTTSQGQQIWVKQLPRGPLTAITRGSGSAERPAWSPDGRQVAFIRRPGLSRSSIWIQRSDGSASAESLVVESRNIDEVAWAPDGRSVLYRVGGAGAGSRDLYATRIPAAGTPRPILTENFDELGADVSPDGRWFAYVSNESGRNEVYVRRYDDPGAGRTQVSVAGGAEPRWAHSGRELFFRGPRAEMMVAEVTLGAAFRARPPRVLFPATRMASDYFHRSYDVSPDDRRFLMILASESQTELVLVVNWFEELKGMVLK
jgi:serine/threonine-protein kinase